MRKPIQPPPKTELVDLYIAKKKSAVEIGLHYGVSKALVLSWMTDYSIPRRPAGRGLQNRGIKQPTRAELFDLVHKQYKSYSAIAAIYGVDQSAIQHWLLKHKIKPRSAWETRCRGKQIKRLSPRTLQTLYWGECLSASIIGDRYGINRTTVTKWLGEAGIIVRSSGFNNGRRYACKDGHCVRSVYEQRVDDWLFDHGIAHEYEPPMPSTSTMHKRCRADFRVGNTYIEVWGVHSSNSYKTKKREKIKCFANSSAKLVGLSISSFSTRANGKWKRQLSDAFIPSQPQLSLPQERS